MLSASIQCRTVLAASYLFFVVMELLGFCTSSQVMGRKKIDVSDRCMDISSLDSEVLWKELNPVTGAGIPWPLVRANILFFSPMLLGLNCFFFKVA
ncbi:hypothetical protein K402DRAFT_32116 [Aulographum hederae CBS 113979]|uniref:Uncharacterized protein n=1 Tax=Aulographum hederae CBS 113979 TaxID=1176131 RepID=A0A6G1H4X8_9PEZI|nr:hypothetical protein K402DRAFT_32116 [Aulographum hederae CBS 113979]